MPKRKKKRKKKRKRKRKRRPGDRKADAVLEQTGKHIVFEKKAAS
jgi:hypothetical protein